MMIFRYYIFDNPVFNSAEKIPLIQSKWIQEKKCPILVTSGRLAEDKHIEIPIKILAEVIKEKEACLLILGEGNKKQYLLDLCKELKILDRVRFEGFVNNPISYLMLCDVYLQTSEIESFGNGVIEAQYCNLPSVVTDCGGPIKLIEQNKYGINIGKYNDTRTILLPGISIGSASIIGAAAVVTKKVEENELWGGNPAKMIKRLDE